MTSRFWAITSSAMRSGTYPEKRGFPRQSAARAPNVRESKTTRSA
jgi:hypothetical protein